MGYQYHQKRCGKQLAEADKPVFSCLHCGKKYKSKAGHDYHVRSEHPASVSPPDTSTTQEVGPSLPGGDCRAAEPVGRSEPGRAGPGKAGADVRLMLFILHSHYSACVVPCGVGREQQPSLPLQESRELFLSKGRGWQFLCPPASPPSMTAKQRSDHVLKASCSQALGWGDPSLGSILFCSVDPCWQCV